MRLFATMLAGLGAVALVPGELAAQGYGYGYGPGMMNWNGGWYGMIFGPFFMIVVLAATIAAIVILVRWLGGSAHGHAPLGRTSLDILKERYARGDIDKAEFEERRKVLAD